MHCLPANRGEEVSAEAIDGARSVVFQQAGNRMHVQKALLAWLLEGRVNLDIAEMFSRGSQNRVVPPLCAVLRTAAKRYPNSQRTFPCALTVAKRDQLRPLTFQRHFTGQAPGSVLVKMGRTTVLCTCCVEATVPPFLVGSGKGWLTAEYAMLPGSTHTRKARDRGGKVDGRSVEIQRLIGRSLRAIVDLSQLGERTLAIDCDVLEADGGTRTASINGAFLALVDALHASAARPAGLLPPLPAPRQIVRDSIAAVSIGLYGGVELLDLNYKEDNGADVDLNLVMTGRGAFVEVQAGGEEATFDRAQLDRLLALGTPRSGRSPPPSGRALGSEWPLD